MEDDRMTHGQAEKLLASFDLNPRTTIDDLVEASAEAGIDFADVQEALHLCSTFHVEAARLWGELLRLADDPASRFLS